MSKYNYLKALENNIRCAIIGYTKYETEWTRDDLFSDNDIVGHNSGSYWYNIEAAWAALIDNIDLVDLVIEKEGYSYKTVIEDPELIDVSIREYLFDAAYHNVMQADLPMSYHTDYNDDDIFSTEFSDRTKEFYSYYTKVYDLIQEIIWDIDPKTAKEFTEPWELTDYIYDHITEDNFTGLKTWNYVNCKVTDTELLKANRELLIEAIKDIEDIDYKRIFHDPDYADTIMKMYVLNEVLPDLVYDIDLNVDLVG